MKVRSKSSVEPLIIVYVRLYIEGSAHLFYE